MSIFTPTYYTKKVTDITYDFLNRNKFKGIILDIDDTLAPHRYPIPEKEVITWINNLKNSGIKIVLVSNNFKDRVGKFAKQLSVPYICMGMKPLPFGIKKAIKMLNISIQNLLVVGDQIFTDIVGANFLKIKSVLVEPVSKSKTILLKIKRFLEKPIRKKLIHEKNFFSIKK